MGPPAEGRGPRSSGVSGFDKLKKGPDWKQLERIFEDFKKLGFPPRTRFKEIQDIHDQLILYDADVGAAVGRVLVASAPTRDLENLTGLQEDGELESMIVNVVKKFPANHDIGKVGRQYANYYDMIKKVIATARSYLGSQTTW
jgi:hypothetical protein